MKNLRKIIFAVTTFFSLSIVPQISAAANDAWISVRSKNFHLVGNAGEAEMRRSALRLEQFRYVFTQLFAEMNFNSPIPTTVIVFKDDVSFSQFKPIYEDGARKDFVAGYFLPGTDVNYIALPVKDEKKKNEHSFSTIYHEYVHFLVDNTLGRTNIPPWFNEGFAEYYEQFKVENDRKATLGAVNNSHLALLRKNGFIPFDKFFAVDYYTLDRQPKEDVIGYYAQAWALTHYLIQGNKGARSEELRRFSRLLLKGKPAKEAFEEAFKTNYAAMESEVKNYVERKTFEVSSINFDVNFITENEMKAAPVTAAEAKAYQADLLFHLNRLDAASKYARESLALDPELGFANTTFGLIKLKEKNLVEARKHLEKAVQTDTQNYFAHYSYAYVLSREGMSDFGFVVGYSAAVAEKIRESLRKAITLNPKFAESYHLYAFVNIARNERFDEALEMINKALEIAPGNQWYALRTAEIYMRKENFADARRIAQKILQTVSDDQLKLNAQNTLNLTNSWEAQLEAIKNYRRRPDEQATDKILSEEEIAALNEKAMLTSLNESLRKPRTGEKRILGFLTDIECGSKEVIYSFKADNQLIKFRSDTFEEVALTAFAATDSKYGCGTLKKEVYAVITYRTGGETKSKIAGETVAIEFVPNNFKFVELKTEK
jgi:tetratricopeptide (TPR) repeat protein